MRDRNKGFTLLELMVTVSILVILATVGVPSFLTMIAKTRADTDVGDFYRALNVARLEAINRGVSVRVATTPSSSTGWTLALNVQVSIGGLILRAIPPMSTNSTMTPSTAVSYIEFNNLGVMSYPTTTLTMAYANSGITRNVGVCLNGRVVLNGVCG
jgi:type IV fimbrial biogenesis protein FimU